MSYLVPSGLQNNRLDISPATDGADTGCDVIRFRQAAEYFANEGSVARWLLNLLSSLFNFALKQRFPHMNSYAVFTRFGYGGGQNQIIVNLDHNNFEFPERILARIDCSARVVILNPDCVSKDGIKGMQGTSTAVAGFLKEFLEQSGMGEFFVRYPEGEKDAAFLKHGQSSYKPITPNYD